MGAFDLYGKVQPYLRRRPDWGAGFWMIVGTIGLVSFIKAICYWP